MLWSDRLVMVIDNNWHNSVDKEEDTLGNGRNDVLECEMMS
jgi:hypothetical protein